MSWLSSVTAWFDSPESEPEPVALTFRALSFPAQRSLPKEFEVSLYEARQWCAAHARLSAPRTSLRHAELLPSHLSADDPDEVSRELAVDPASLVAHVVQTRRAQLPKVAGSAAGRLFAYHPEENLCDGAAVAESEGFLDVENAPPWDTWVGWIEGNAGQPESGCLLAWVPGVFCPHANGGVEVNAEECIYWLPEG